MNTTPKPDPDDIDSANQVYGDDTLTFDLNHLEGERCERSSSGSHSYIIVAGLYKCMCCGADGGEV